MNQFSEAIKTGIEAAAIAEANFREILAAINEVGNAVEEVTTGTVTILRAKVRAEEPKILDIGRTARIAMGLEPERLVDAIIAKRTVAPHSSTELARLELAPAGYPCTITFGERKYTSSDKASWAESLKELLASPRSGKAIIELQKLMPADTEEQ